MKIAFFGTPQYAVPTLRALVDAGHEVVRVITQPDRPSGRGRRLRPPAVALAARELGLDVRQPKAIRSGPFPRNFRALQLDVGIVVAYGRILPAPILAHPPLGMINGHGSLLPRWRGSAPIERALMAGDAETGVSTMLMDEGLDTGALLLTRATPILPEDDAGSLRARLAELTAALIVETLADLSAIRPRPQPDEGVCHAPPLRREEARIRWEEPAVRCHNRVRAFSERRGCLASFRGEPFKLRRTAPARGEGVPGVVLSVDKRLLIACGQGALEVLEAQLPGRKVRSRRDLINGARIRAGEVFS